MPIDIITEVDYNDRNGCSYADCTAGREDIPGINRKEEVLNVGMNKAAGQKRYIKVICGIGYALSELIGLACGVLLTVVLKNGPLSGILVGVLCILTTIAVAGIGCLFFWAIDDASHNAEGYMHLRDHIVRTVLLGNLWTVVWTGRTTGYLNTQSDIRRSAPVGQMLLCMFVPFYIIYWFHHQGQKCDNAVQMVYKNAPGKAKLYTILSIFAPAASSIVMQFRINRLASKE